MRALLTGLFVVVWCQGGALAAPVQPLVIYAEQLVGSSAPDPAGGPSNWPYGAAPDPANPGSYLVGIALGDLSFATDRDPETAVSLPTGIFVTLGFSSPILDGEGADIFVTELGANGERADVFGAARDGDPFTFLGVATGGATTGFDLSGLGFASGLRLLKTVGLDREGQSPGFDLALVTGLLRAPTTVDPTPPGPPPTPAPVPVPAAFWMMAAGLAALTATARRRR
jgi:hypothetical protein